MAVSVSAKVALTSNSACVNSGLLLCCLPNRIDHHHCPFQANVSEKVIKDQPGTTSWKYFGCTYEQSMQEQQQSAASCIGHQQEAVTTLWSQTHFPLQSHTQIYTPPWSQTHSVLRTFLQVDKVLLLHPLP